MNLDHARDVGWIYALAMACHADNADAVAALGLELTQRYEDGNVPAATAATLAHVVGGIVAPALAALRLYGDNLPQRLVAELQSELDAHPEISGPVQPGWSEHPERN